MFNKLDTTELENRIKKFHSDDEKQIEVIFSRSKKLIVEAPAGYGKTKTMISKIAYMLASNQVKNPNKVLALTFSVNAAYKIKKDVAEQLPDLLQSQNSYVVKPKEKLFISNYHGFCRHILKRYGYLLHDHLTDIDALKTVDDSCSSQFKIDELIRITGLGYESLKIFEDYNNAVKDVDREYIIENSNSYLEGVKQKFLNKNYIPFNAIIVLVLELFQKYPEILKFYQGYFSTIIVDEFQDTNILSWILLKRIITDNTRVIFIGDSLQRIYGFIGAIPDLMVEAEELYNMNTISLDKNYRFKDNLQMLLLDQNIRLNAENPATPKIVDHAKVAFCNPKNQDEEAKEILKKINVLSNNATTNYKIAILVKMRGANIDKILECLSKNQIPYFYALFSDEDHDYLRFHRECSFRFFEQIKNKPIISKTSLYEFHQGISQYFLGQNRNKLIISSLLDLLKVFLKRVITEYNFLELEDKIVFIKDTFENNALKQNMEYIDKNVIVSTIHGAKGLEWDYVIMPDMEQYSNPNWKGLCGKCLYKSDCNIRISSANETKFLEELSVFYVGVTRARKQVFFSASQTRINYQGVEKKANTSCLLKLPGVQLHKAHW